MTEMLKGASAAMLAFLLLNICISGAQGSSIQDNSSPKNSSTLEYLNNTAYSGIKLFDAVGNLLYAILRTIAIFLGLFLLIMTALWVRSNEGVFIQPFTVGSCSKSYDGSAISDLLISELQRIRSIYIPDKELKSKESWSSKLKRLASAIMDEPASSVKIQLETIPGYNQNAPGLRYHPSAVVTIPQAMPINQSLAYSVSSINVNSGPVSISSDQILRFLKRICGRPVNIIAGSLQRYNEEDHLVAWMGQSSIGAWKVTTKNELGDSAGQKKDLPAMVNELAYMIAKEINEETFEAKTWKGLMYFTEALDAYNIYCWTGSEGLLNRSKDLCFNAINAERDFRDGPSRLLYNLGSAFLNRGIEFDKKESYAEAERLFRKSLSLKPDEGSAFIGLGLALFYQEKYQDAISSNDKAIRLYEEAILEGQTQDDFSRVLLEATPNLAKAWHNKGAILFQRDEWDDSIRAYDEAIKVYDNALKMKHDYLDARTGKSSALYGKGNAFSRQEKHVEAINAYDGAIDAYNGIIRICDEASKYRENGLEIKRSYMDAYTGIGLAYNWKGYSIARKAKYEEAIKGYDEAIEAYDKAMDAYHRALKIKPDYFEALLGLARTMHNKGNALAQKGDDEEAIRNFNDAIRDYDNALRITPEDTDALMDLAKAWDNKGSAFIRRAISEETLEAYDEAKKAYDESAESYANAIKVYGSLRPLMERSNN